MKQVHQFQIVTLGRKKVKWIKKMHILCVKALLLTFFYHIYYY